MKKLSRTNTALLLTFLVIVWGVNWPLSKMALNYAPPILFAGIRTILGGLILLIFALPRYKSLRFKETWHFYLISAFLNIILFYGLQTVGLGYAPAGLFSAIVFIEPVLLGIFCWIWLGESMYGLKIIGLILGFAGVAIISGGGFTGDISAIGIILALGSALSWGLGTVFIKKTGDRVDSIWLVTLQLIMGGLLLLSVGTSVESWSNIQWEMPFITNLLFISTFVIAFGWLAFFTLIGSGEASKVGSFTFLIPLIAILCSSFFLQEQVTLNVIVGLLFILISILFVNIKLKSQTVLESGL
ncbi:DMT family transporter [Peribacillus psychrosaccharolyticus]|uniref:DMT family transporter n=1 Tax=Peribacillus psychrosaccharolyticus TaxID=1407 RepID=A0A974NNS0_PERPY|nr:DMT family transporter [Peribacillus psychrosaccharolyticus]MEC2054113.1 DMT family transporter [Peribacillus psychrosaccharolyticus]MED3742266.1 DMT family transporter [Peribacillus psychrosaccharolyticus]QQT01250.1 DMT family transporter [Peribacillus psychrosaccharolyticus]